MSWSFTSLFTGRVRIEQIAGEQGRGSAAAGADRREDPEGRHPIPASTCRWASISACWRSTICMSAPRWAASNSHWKVAGSGLVTADGTPSRVKLDMTRSDGPAAHLAADLGFSLDRFSVDGQITAEESTKGGVVAALIGRPDLDRHVAQADRQGRSQRRHRRADRRRRAMPSTRPATSAGNARTAPTAITTQPQRRRTGPAGQPDRATAAGARDPERRGDDQ